MYLLFLIPVAELALCFVTRICGFLAMTNGTTTPQPPGLPPFA